MLLILTYKTGTNIILIANKTEVTSVKLVLFKSVMSFETLTKVDRLTEIVRTRPELRVVFSSV